VVRVLLTIQQRSQETLAAQIGTDGPTLCHLLAGKLPHRTDLWHKVWVALLAPSQERRA
jgi:hypothetical protein